MDEVLDAGLRSGWLPDRNARAPRELNAFRQGHACPERIRTWKCNVELSHAHIRDEESCDSPGGQFPARRSKFLAVLDPVQPPQSHLRQRVHMRNQPPASAAENPVGQVSGLRGSLTRRIELISKLVELMQLAGIGAQSDRNGPEPRGKYIHELIASARSPVPLDELKDEGS